MQIASIVKSGHPTIEKLRVRCIMNKVFILIGPFQVNVLVRLLENINLLKSLTLLFLLNNIIGGIMASENFENMLGEAASSFNEASMLSRQRRFFEAIDQYKDAIERLHVLEVTGQHSDNTPSNFKDVIYQNLFHAYGDLGNCYLDLDSPDFGEAARSFLNALVYSKSDATVGNLLYCMGQINAFMSATVMSFKKGEFDDKFANLHNQGYDLLKTNSVAQAAEVLNAAIKINPNFAPTFHLLGLVFEKMQQDNLAIKSWLKVLELEYDFDFATRIKIQLS